MSETDAVQLFDLVSDPSETRDLSATRPTTTEALHQALKSWQRDVDAKFPEANPDWVTATES